MACLSLLITNVRSMRQANVLSSRNLKYSKLGILLSTRESSKSAVASLALSAG